MVRAFNCDRKAPLYYGNFSWKIFYIDMLDKIVKGRFKGWIPAPRLCGGRLGGYDAYSICLILIALLQFPRGRESGKWENPTFYETIKLKLL